MTQARRTLVSGLALAAAATVTIAMLPASAAPLPSLSALTRLSGVAVATPALLSGATDLGPAASQTEHLTFVLAYRNAAALRAFTASAHAPLSATQFADTYGASPATVAAVTSWARAAGLTVASTQGNLVNLTGTTTAVDKALSTRTDTVTAGTQTYRTIATTASLPASLAGSVTAISGLSSLATMHLAAATPTAVTPTAVTPAAATPAAVTPRAAAAGVLPTFDPNSLASFYDAPAADTGAGQTVAVIAEGDLSTITPDLRTFETMFGLPARAGDDHRPGAQPMPAAPTSSTSTPSTPPVRHPEPPCTSMTGRRCPMTTS